jgi:hypothetical protein
MRRNKVREISEALGNGLGSGAKLNFVTIGRHLVRSANYSFTFWSGSANYYFELNIYSFSVPLTFKVLTSLC